MTDFYTLLKQSIVARGIRDPQHRQAVYSQARAALIRQLAAQKLQTNEIALRVMELDRAMRQIEGELSAELKGEPAPVGVGRAAEADDPYAEPPQAEREPSGWDVRDEAAEDDTGLLPEPEAPLHPARQWREAAPQGRAVVRRGFTPPPEPIDEDVELPPRPFGGQWSDEEAVRTDPPKPAVNRPRLLPPPQRRLGWTLSEKDKIRVLFGAIGALALVLLGLVVFVLLGSRDGGVSTAISSNGEVRDAGTAERIAGQTLDVKQSYTVFDGRDPTVFVASPDNPVRFDSEGGFARVGTSSSSSGVKVQIGRGLADRLAGQNIRIVVAVRSAVERGALNMRMAYQSGVALSHWQTANLTPSYANVGMTWIVPQLRTSQNGIDYLIIEPGIPGDGTAVDINSIRIDIVGSPKP